MTHVEEFKIHLANVESLDIESANVESFNVKKRYTQIPILIKSGGVVTMWKFEQNNTAVQKKNFFVH
jgi:hypothetical protein